MKRVFIYAVFGFFILLLLCGGVRANGIGFYLSTGGGRFSHNDQTLFGIGDPFRDTLFVMGGLVSDTNLATRDLFNYRNKIGVGWLGSGFTPVKSFFRLSLENIFGFSVFWSKRYRVWIGPLAGFSYINGKRMFYELRSYSGTIVPITRTSRYSLGGIDFGIALGINMNISKYLAITMDAGFRYNVYFNFLWEEQSGSGMSKYVGLIGAEGFASVAIMYRGRLLID